MKKAYLPPFTGQMTLPEESVLFYTSPDGKIKAPTDPQSLLPGNSGAPTRLGKSYI